jgi:hypothetical protein
MYQAAVKTSETDPGSAILTFPDRESRLRFVTESELVWWYMFIEEDEAYFSISSPGKSWWDNPAKTRSKFQGWTKGGAWVEEAVDDTVDSEEPRDEEEDRW